MEFNDWLFESLAYAEAAQIARRIRSPRYEPGRFGVEITFSSTDGDVDRWSRTLQEMGATVDDRPNEDRSSWTVVPKGGDIEVASPSLSLRDIPFLKQVLGRMKSERFVGQTNVHIGMPSNGSPFDVIALTIMINEAHARMGSGDGDFHDVLYGIFPPGVQDGDHILSVLKSTLRSPILHSFFQNGIIDFNHPAVDVVRNPEVFCNWIEYFLLMPRVAKSRRQIHVRTSQGDIIFNRDQNGQVRVDKPRSAPVPPPTPEPEREDTSKLTGTFRDLGRRMPPQHQTHMAVVLRNLFPKRDVSRTPIVSVWRQLPSSLQQMILQTIK